MASFPDSETREHPTTSTTTTDDDEKKDFFSQSGNENIGEMNQQPAQTSEDSHLSNAPMSSNPNRLTANPVDSTQQVHQTQEQSQSSRICAHGSDAATGGSSQIHHSSAIPPSTAEKVFSGRSGSGASYMCGNLQANPFLVRKDDSSSSNTILAKPRFSLKSSSINNISAKDKVQTNGVSNSVHSSSSIQTNPFLRPAMLKVEEEVSSTEKNGEGGAAKNQTPADKLLSTTASPTISSTNLLPESGSQACDSTSNNELTSTSSTAGSNLFTQRLTSYSANFAKQSSSFVFGQQLGDRVTNAPKEVTNSESEPPKVEEHKAKTLQEAADEYKKQQASGPILPEVELVTGEENESNVLQTCCKLFFFEKADQTWHERGRGLLRLNDDNDNKHSRVVMRSSGILKVILNIQIWPSMTCERASTKSIRLTGVATDSQIHVYLLTGSAADMDQLYGAITCRIQKLKLLASEDDSNTSKRKTDQNEEISSKKAKLDDEGRIDETEFNSDSALAGSAGTGSTVLSEMNEPQQD